MPSGGTDLGNQATLAKIDKLRELNVGAIIPLPQLVVVGDQSSGKSSVLESLTGFSFPRAPGLCTRYATQITCCREAESGVRVTIIPRPDADETLKTKLLQFKRHLSSIDGNNLANVFEEANIAMGIRMGDRNVDHGAFSQDILKIEISGPDQQHLTVIDVPGIFRVPTPGLTTESDIFLIENMVNSYMTNPRTMSVSAILFGWLKLLTCSSNLAVIPCNVDIATQEILKLAELADPEGVRTMGVLTKPDLATETATRSAIIDLVLGKQSILRLGYYVVKNPCRFRNGIFMAPAWSSIADRCGTTALKCKVRELLMQISKQEFPHVKADIEQRLRQRRTELENMGPPRAGSIAQRMYLGKLASRFQTITQAALSGYYAGDDIFKKLPNLKLITQIMQLNEAFSDVFWKKGHKQHFEATMDDEGESPLGCTVNQLPFEIPLDKYPELGTIICTNEYQCSSPSKGTLMDHIKEVYESSRGPELGTFGGTILATIFEDQSKKWQPLTLSHVSKVIILVHEYMFQVLTETCPETLVRDNLWETILLDRLIDSYKRAMEQTHFLLEIERKGTPNTFNHYFNANLQKRRGKRMRQTFATMAVTISGGSADERHVPLSKIGQHTVDKDNKTQVCEDILDALMSYYKVSRKRFVDVICQQVVFHLLLEGDGSPLKVFDPELIMKLDDEHLEQIAGEDEASKHHRQVLKREIESLEAALKVLRV
ncbi:interferon-induced GTP-binding protein Mx2 [Phyllosticta citrichinensis]|uniref:Interferon-induced GTP-binding protein Mx2 n=1 Tax=Phyllosticta citrichinensis TaxID=1130410 RepID=A0ABR1XKF9_9PEZI